MMRSAIHSTSSYMRRLLAQPQSTYAQTEDVSAGAVVANLLCLDERQEVTWKLGIASNFVCSMVTEYAMPY